MPVGASHAGSGIEARVARVETGLESVTKNIDSLTNDVRALAQSMRQQSDSIDAQLRQLSVAVTTASGPRKTEWSTIIAGAGLVIGLGASTMSPLYLRLADVQKVLEKQEDLLASHEKQPMHHAGQLQLDHLEKRIESVTATAAMQATLVQKSLDQRFADYQKVMDEVKYQGSPITRERLAVIEHTLKNMERRASDAK